MAVAERVQNGSAAPRPANRPGSKETSIVVTEFLYAIAWPGAGRSLASPWLVRGIAAAVTVPFTAWLLYATRRKPPITSSTDHPPNQFGPPPRSPWVVLLTGALALVPSLVRATPSTTYWAPSTASGQAWKTPHVTYDTYFGKGPAAGSQGAPNYPIDTGLTMGILPSSKSHRQGSPARPPRIPGDVPARRRRAPGQEVRIDR